MKFTTGSARLVNGVSAHIPCEFVAITLKYIEGRAPTQTIDYHAIKNENEFVIIARKVDRTGRTGWAASGGLRLTVFEASGSIEEVLALLHPFIN